MIHKDTAPAKIRPIKIPSDAAYCGIPNLNTSGSESTPRFSRCVNILIIQIVSTSRSTSVSAPSDNDDLRNHRPSRGWGFEGSPYLGHSRVHSPLYGNYDLGHHRPCRRFQIASRCALDTSALADLDTIHRLERPAIASYGCAPVATVPAALDTAHRRGCSSDDAERVSRDLHTARFLQPDSDEEKRLQPY